MIIVTEPCIPFRVWLQQQQPKPTLDQIIYGLQCVITALSFLHTSANVSHGNVTMDALYVTPAGDVKLWNFALVTSFTTSTSTSTTTSTTTNNHPPLSIPRHFMDHESILTPLSYRSPERIEQRYDVIAATGVHVMDSYSVGILISELFNPPFPYTPLPTVLVKAVQRLQTSNLKMRPKLSPLLKCPLFTTNPYIQLQMLMMEFPVMTIEQKIIFWNDTMTSHLQPSNNNNSTGSNNHHHHPHTIPPNVILQKILPLMKNEIMTICENEMLRTQE